MTTSAKLHLTQSFFVKTELEPFVRQSGQVAPVFGVVHLVKKSRVHLAANASNFSAETITTVMKAMTITGWDQLEQYVPENHVVRLHQLQFLQYVTDIF